MRSISAKDKEILRNLAAKQIQLAKSAKNLEKIRQWKLHNDFRGDYPLIHLELWTFQHEIVEPQLVCETAFSRDIERQLYINFTNSELFDDDKIVPDYYPVKWQTFFKPFGLEEQVTHLADGGLGHHFNPVINDLKEDYHKLNKSEWGADKKANEEFSALIEETFGDILPVKRVMNCLYSVPTQKLVHFMGMENMMFAMCDYPELFKDMMSRFADDTLAYYRWLEGEKLILPTVNDESLGQGSLCFTEELPDEAILAQRPLVSRDVWGFMDSQETVGVSPEMFEEFIFPCYKRIADKFGLLSYGCCEPVHPIWENCISKFTNLRKVSISPWCDEEFMGEQLSGKRVIFHRKPSPNYLGVGKNFEEESFRDHIRKSLKAASGCKMEITQRDVYTINYDIPKAKRYIAIIRDEIDRCWKT